MWDNKVVLQNCMEYLTWNCSADMSGEATDIQLLWVLVGDLSGLCWLMAFLVYGDELCWTEGSGTCHVG